ncbi:N-acetyltransferase family protein [Rubrivirga sp.]|uniref:GNAT family N-acetyltransferase n=1 Tax=Rubrivirga sp. TaxID=1885344 RepID=UPI003C7344BD
MCIPIRTSVPADIPHLARIYGDAVRSAGPSHYTADQVEAWAAWSDDAEAFNRSVLRARTFVAEESGELVGFSTLEPDGRVGMLYVRGDHQRRGLGGRLLAAAVTTAVEGGMDHAYAEASAFSLPVFLGAGFEVTKVETVERGGVAFERHRVEREFLPLADRNAGYT